jgi:SAM-dependent methyltransferase
MTDFYDQLTPFYHLIYGDWEAAVEQQATQLSNIIQETWGEQGNSILDVSCGIGTQTIGLAAKGYQVTASDLSAKEVERARKEAQKRNLEIEFSVCDMRKAYQHHQAEFDVVICCDNSIPHLLTDEDILQALRQMYACTCAGGGCLLTMRDYDREPKGKGIMKPYGVREKAGKRYLIFQAWDFEGEHYDLSFYFVEDDGSANLINTHVMRSRYYALSPNHMMQLMKKAGFTAVRRLDEAFFQPVLIGTKNTAT